jgi:hypothetical protein
LDSGEWEHNSMGTDARYRALFVAYGRSKARIQLHNDTLYADRNEGEAVGRFESDTELYGKIIANHMNPFSNTIGYISASSAGVRE